MAATKFCRLSTLCGDESRAAICKPAGGDPQRSDRECRRALLDLTRGRIRCGDQAFRGGRLLSPVERYLRWVSAFDEEAKQNLYSDGFRHETAQFRTAGILEPWFAKANGAGIVDASLLPTR